MLNTKNDWASLFLLSYTKKPLGVDEWRKILDGFMTAPQVGGKSPKLQKSLEFDGINVYSEPIKTKIIDKYGSTKITTGHWKGRNTNAEKLPYIEVVKANFRKADHKPFTPEQLGFLRERFRLDLQPGLTSQVDHLGIDYYPYKDPFKVDKGLPKNPSLPFDWTLWGLAAAAVVGIVAYKKKVIKL